MSSLLRFAGTGLVFCVASVGSVGAEDAGGGGGRADDEVVAEAGRRRGKDSLEGLYFGVGVGWDRRKTKVGDATLETFVGANAEAEPLGGFELINPRVGAFVALGYGAFVVDEYYAAVETSVEFKKSGRAGRKYFDGETVNEPILELKSGGVIPSVQVKLGRWFDDAGGIAYLALGFSRCATELKNINQNWKGESCRRKMLTPTVGVGFEKAVGLGLSLNAEGVYRFRCVKTDKLRSEYGGVKAVLKSKLRARGFGVRLGLNYRIPIYGRN
jgi:hypothetical protein